MHKDTLIEEHIVGIPGDQFIKYHLHDKSLNEIRLAKEFVKFNERCFGRLLGDMHSSNFVVDVTPDFEEVSYRIRAIDFDQQSYEGRRAIYLPQYFKQNNPLIELGLKHMTPATVRQYQREERSLISNRMSSARLKIKDLMDCMCNDTLSRPDYIDSLKGDLHRFYGDKDFLKCRNMGDLVKLSLMMVFRRPDLYK